jgi:hypothetical protein
MQTRAFAALLAAALLTVPAAAAAQTVGPRMGIIPGTDMTRDEFRARAQAQLAAVALNALTYYVANGSYAPDIYTLQASPAWNLRINNMFTGRPIQGVYFEPTPSQMTKEPPVGLGGIAPPDLNMPPTGLNQPKQDGKPNIVVIPGNASARVNPAAIRDHDPGDIFYYAKGDLLQLILFAPDNSYFEYVDEQPNGNYRGNLRLRTNQPAENLYAAQVLYFVETLAGQHYNLVQFMGDQKTVPGAQVGQLPGSKKIELAGRIGITVVNPITKKPLTAGKECSPGNILEGTPLKICTATGPALSMAEMTMGREEQGAMPAPKAKPQAKPKPGTRQPGGPRPGAPGGGRRN